MYTTRGLLVDGQIHYAQVGIGELSTIFYGFSSTPGGAKWISSTHSMVRFSFLD